MHTLRALKFILAFFLIFTRRTYLEIIISFIIHILNYCGTTYILCTVLYIYYITVVCMYMMGTCYTVCIWHLSQYLWHLLHMYQYFHFKVLSATAVIYCVELEFPTLHVLEWPNMCSVTLYDLHEFSMYPLRELI